VAIASALFADADHYVTTDASLAVHGLIDQPIPTVTVVLSTVRRRSVSLGRSVVRPVVLAPRTFANADAYESTIEGFRVRLASREQAIVDAVAEPRWITHSSLLPEVLAAFDEAELERAAQGALGRSTAAGQRLGYLLGEAGRVVPASLSSLRPVSAAELRPGAPHTHFSTRWRVYG
jgi:predicted transcriptional regulator of viral defense system